jgi:hypothetical protein
MSGRCVPASHRLMACCLSDRVAAKAIWDMLRRARLGDQCAELRVGFWRIGYLSHMSCVRNYSTHVRSEISGRNQKTFRAALVAGLGDEAAAYRTAAERRILGRQPPRS